MPDVYERAYPWIPWRTPLLVVAPDGQHHYACRLCVAAQGLRVEDCERLYATAEAVEAHLVARHGEGKS